MPVTIIEEAAQQKKIEQPTKAGITTEVCFDSPANQPGYLNVNKDGTLYIAFGARNEQFYMLVKNPPKGIAAKVNKWHEIRRQLKAYPEYKQQFHGITQAILHSLNGVYEVEMKNGNKKGGFVLSPPTDEEVEAVLVVYTSFEPKGQFTAPSDEENVLVGKFNKNGFVVAFLTKEAREIQFSVNRKVVKAEIAPPKDKVLIKDLAFQG